MNALQRLLAETPLLERPAPQQSQPRRSGVVRGLYFSAGRCEACRTFDVALREFCERSERRGGPGRPEPPLLDVVFVSSDESEEEFRRHLERLPPSWPAVPYEQRTKALQLSRIVRARTIPTLVLIEGATGRVITREGRKHVTENPSGEGFPWRPLTLDALLHRGPLVDAEGKPRFLADSDSRVKCLYFSANWCPPCKAFTPQLADTYAKAKAKGHKLEVIFVSSDRSQESFDQYFGAMPWLAVPYAEEKWRKDIADLLGVQGIPTLVILDENDKIITRDGRYEVIEDPEGTNFPWKPRPVEVLTDKHSSKLNEDPFLILFTEGSDKDVEQAREMLVPVAQRFAAERDEAPLWFFVGGEAEICESLRDFAQLEDEVPLLVILDMSHGEKYVMEDDVELSKDVAARFVRRFLDGEIQPRAFPQ